MSDLFNPAILTSTLTLFFIMDPLGNVPVFLSVLKDYPPERRRKILARELVFALAIMVFFLVIGRSFLGWLGVSQETIGISGGIVLFIIALKMIFPPVGENPYSTSGEEPFIVPLAIPLIAGPSTIAAILLLDQKHPDQTASVFIAVAAAWGLTALILGFSPVLLKVLRKRGLVALERLMGMVLITVAVEMFLSGIKTYLNH